MVPKSRLDEVLAKNKAMQKKINDIEEAETKNNADALRLMKNNNYDLLVTDVKKHGRDTLKLINKLRKSNINIPNIIVCTTYNNNELPDNLRASGVKYLQKPFNISELEDLINTPTPTAHATSSKSI